jgi:two-component system response regulator DesR
MRSHPWGVAVIRVLLVEDAWLMRNGLAKLLSREEDITIVGDLDFESDLATLAGERWPRVVVINTDYMVSQVLPVVAELKARNPACSVLILSDPTKRGMLPPRRRARGVSFLVKDAPVPLLAEAIRRVAQGERVIHPRLEAASLGTEKNVSTRELEVLGLAAEGESVAEIASRLYLSLGTVRNHLSSAIMKTGARNRIDAIRIARKDGWLR